MGGMLRAIETGYVQREIQEAAYRYQRAVETQDAVVVGVNRFQSEEEAPVPTLRIDESVERAQIERVRSVRERRDQEAARAALIALEDAAHGTVGEISGCLRRVWGEYREAVTV